VFKFYLGKRILLNYLINLGFIKLFVAFMSLHNCLLYCCVLLDFSLGLEIVQNLKLV
jgi:hypothetical protein